MQTQWISSPMTRHIIIFLKTLPPACSQDIHDSLITLFVWGSLGAHTLRNLPAIQETWIRSLGWEDPLEKGMATHSSFLAWRAPWTKKPGRLHSMGSQSWTGLTLSLFFPVLLVPSRRNRTKSLTLFKRRIGRNSFSSPKQLKYQPHSQNMSLSFLC